MADYINEVQKLYVAYFSRPADAAGLTFWANQLAIDFIATVKDLESAAAARDPGKIDAVISAIVQAGASGMDDVHLVGVQDLPPAFA
jgi:hypothetical protein